MIPLSGKKIFILYPDSFLREEIFHGSLRNQFQIYFIFDYEKIRSLVEYYPGSIICLNRVDNDLDWLVDELKGELSDLPEEDYPKIAVLSDLAMPEGGFCCRNVDCRRPPDEVKTELQQMFIDWGGKGRRNFVRYGGNGESVAVIRTASDGQDLSGTVHDISASGLSCSFNVDASIPISSEEIQIKLDLGEITLDLSAIKILERDFNEQTIHVLQFDRKMPESRLDALYRFIHRSLDSSMEEFIKKLSN